MINIESALHDFPVLSLCAGETLLKQDEKTNSIYFLRQGSVEIIKDDCVVALSSDSGAVFGEMSIMLDCAHSATVNCVTDSMFYHIHEPRNYLDTHPEVIWHIAEIMSRRIYSLNRYFVNLKGHYEKPIQQEAVIPKNYSEHQKMINEALKILQVQ